jgi:hypothetical protein
VSCLRLAGAATAQGVRLKDKNFSVSRHPELVSGSIFPRRITKNLKQVQGDGNSNHGSPA